METNAKVPISKPLTNREFKNLQVFLQIGGSFLILVVMLILLLNGIGVASFRSLTFIVFGLTGLLIAGIVFIKPEVGAYILTFTIYTNFSDVLEINGFPSVNKPLVVMVTISLILGNIFRERRVFRIQRSELLLSIFGIVSALTFFVARDSGTVIDWAINFTKDVVILMIIVYALRTKTTWQRALWILILSAAFLALLGLYQVLWDDFSTQFFGLAKVHFDSSVANGIGATRLHGPIDDPNFYGQIMVAVLPLALYQVLDARSRLLRLIAAVASLLIGFAVIYSYSRGAFLALAFVVVVFVFSRTQAWSWRLLILSLAIPIYFLLPNSYTARLQTLLSFWPTDETAIFQDNSLRGRSSEIQAGFLMWRDHPIMGVGVENYTIRYQEYAQQVGLEYRSEPRETHSLYVQILAETGIIGLSIFGGFLVALFTSTRQTLRRLQTNLEHAELRSWVTSLRLGIAAYLISSIFLHADYFRYLILIIALVIAANHLVDRLLSNSAPPQPYVPVTSP